MGIYNSGGGLKVILGKLKVDLVYLRGIYCLCCSLYKTLLVDMMLVSKVKVRYPF